MRISDWSSDVCSSDLAAELLFEPRPVAVLARLNLFELLAERFALVVERGLDPVEQAVGRDRRVADRVEREGDAGIGRRVVGRVASRVEQRLDRAGIGFERLLPLGIGRASCWARVVQEV